MCLFTKRTYFLEAAIWPVFCCADPSILAHNFSEVDSRVGCSTIRCSRFRGSSQYLSTILKIKYIYIYISNIYVYTFSRTNSKSSWKWMRMEDSFPFGGPLEQWGCLESDLRAIKTARSRLPGVIHLVTMPAGFIHFLNCANWCWKSEAYKKEIKNTRCFLRSQWLRAKKSAGVFFHSFGTHSFFQSRAQMWRCFLSISVFPPWEIPQKNTSQLFCFSNHSKWSKKTMLKKNPAIQLSREGFFHPTKIYCPEFEENAKNLLHFRQTSLPHQEKKKYSSDGACVASCLLLVSTVQCDCSCHHPPVEPLHHHTMHPPHIFVKPSATWMNLQYTLGCLDLRGFSTVSGSSHHQAYHGFLLRDSDS